MGCSINTIALPTASLVHLGNLLAVNFWKPLSQTSNCGVMSLHHMLMTLSSYGRHSLRLRNTVDAIIKFDSWGFVFHPEKSVFQPSQRLVFWAHIVNSIKMTVNLTMEKATNICQAFQLLLNKQKPTIREVAQTISKIASSLPGLCTAHFTIDHLNQTRHLPLGPQRVFWESNDLIGGFPNRTPMVDKSCQVPLSTDI